MVDKNKIRYDSPEAAQKVTREGYLSRDGSFWEVTRPDAEHMARYSGCTHMICDCGVEYERAYGVRCNACQKKEDDIKFQAMEFKEWDGETPLVIFKSDEYFWNADDVESYCDEHVIQVDDLQLCICEPLDATYIDLDCYYEDMLPEEQGIEEVAPELHKAISKFNEVVGDYKRPLSWVQGKLRTSVFIGILK